MGVAIDRDGTTNEIAVVDIAINNDEVALPRNEFFTENSVEDGLG